MGNRCQHMNFKVVNNVARLTETEGGPVTGFDLTAKVNCADCGMAFQWLGLEMGSSFKEPMVSPDRTELRAPITPVEEL